MRLEEQKESIWKCNHCSMCSEMVCDVAGYYKVCPVYQVLEFENYTARGHNTIALYLLEGSLKYNQELADVIFKCTTCRICEEVCKPMGNAVAGLGGYGLKSILDEVIKPLNIDMSPIPSVAIMETMRADCVERGLVPQGLKEAVARIEKSGNIYGRPAAERTRWAEGLKLSSSARTVLFVGDAAAYKAPEVARAAVSILRRAGTDVCILADEKNSGAVLFRTGHLAQAEKVARHNIEHLKALGANEVICLSAADYYTVARDWPRLNVEQAFKVRHISTVLAGLIKSRRIRMTKSVPAVVTYEDPCDLGRGMNIYADPRIVLNAIPGLKLSELYPNAHAAWCCGNCGGVPESDPALALKLGERKLPLVKATGATLIATACPESKVHLQKVIAHNRLACLVKDIVELAAEAMEV
jgi:heterodisulfide reductase subunit D